MTALAMRGLGRGRLLGAGALAVAVIAPLVLRDPFFVGIIVMVYFWAAAATAWNLSGGYAGQLSLGHAAFFGIGAYTSTKLFLAAGVSPWIGMWVGAALAAGFALVIGGITLRLRGSFFVMATLAFGAVVHIVAVNWRTATGGSSGLSLPFRPGLAAFVFGSKLTYAYVALALLLVCYGIAVLIERSRLGYALVAFRENDDAARAIGIHTLRARLTALALSAALTAVCGTFYAQYVLYIDPDSVCGLPFSLQVALLAIVGGLGTSLGPVAGSLLVTPLGHVLVATLGGATSGLYLVVYGVALIAVLLLMPHGIAPALARRFRGQGS